MESLHFWQEHYEAALNHPLAPCSTVLENEAAQAFADRDMSVDEPPLGEVTRAISKLKIGRAAGPDGIPRELLKCAISPVTMALHTLFIQVRKSEHILSDWRYGILIALYKGKGFRSVCSNYRITLCFWKNLCKCIAGTYATSSQYDPVPRTVYLRCRSLNDRRHISVTPVIQFTR